MAKSNPNSNTYGSDPTGIADKAWHDVIPGVNKISSIPETPAKPSNANNVGGGKPSGGSKGRNK